MMLKSLKVTNFGVFSGYQAVNLAPLPNRPIILFGGKNGAGKSTLLEALRLCLYGQASLGPRVSKDDYHQYLEGRIHYSPTVLIPANFAKVELDFQCVNFDGMHSYTMSRGWERRSTSRVEETVRLSRDGEPVDDISAEYCQDFVRDLVPPGVSQFFFFDGEKIQHLAEDSSDQATLTQAIHSLLGIDVVDSLSADLTIYRSRLGKPHQNEQQLRDEDLNQEEMDRVQDSLMQAESQCTILADELGALAVSLSKLEDQIASQGGAFAQNRHRLLAHKAQLTERIDQHEGALRQEAAGLLPFCFSKTLLQNLADQISTDAEVEKQAHASDVLAKVKRSIIAHLGRSKSIGIKPQQKKVITDDLCIILDRFSKQGSEGRVVHPISPATRRELLAWLDQIPALRERIRGRCKELEKSHQELHRTENQLLKAPADDVLAPLLANLREVNGSIRDAQTRHDETVSSRDSLAMQLKSLERQKEQLFAARAKSDSVGTTIEVIPRVQNALRNYKLALIEKKLKELEASVTQCFHVLSRKKDVLRTIHIAPDTAAITLRDKKGNIVPKAQLSAGEKQIYAISMLWALAKTSGRPLPVIIDTPLGRLDSDHRALLAESYFPIASHQVVILSTDTEIDRAYFDAMKSQIARTYTFDFQQEHQGTRIQEGYFWEEPRHEADKTAFVQGSV